MGTRDDRTVWPSSVGEGTPGSVVKTSVKPHAMARSRSTSARSRTGRARASGGSGTTSTPAPGTENTVFVGGLPMEASPESLGWYFAHYGTVLSVKLIYDKHTGQSRSTGSSYSPTSRSRR